MSGVMRGPFFPDFESLLLVQWAGTYQWQKLSRGIVTMADSAEVRAMGSTEESPRASPGRHHREQKQEDRAVRS